MAEKEAMPKAGRDGADGIFTRKSVKYIIHNSYVPALKQALEFNMGVSPFTLSTGEVVHTQQVHSVYFDNEELGLYHERVVKADNSKIVRVRWYGDSLARSSVFVERKKHHDSEAKATGKQSTKKRAELPLARVEPYLNGNWKCEGENVPGFIGKTQNLVRDCQLRPMVQTLYDRTSFQNDNNNNLRITLDENVRIYKERHTWPEIVAADGRPVGVPATMGFAVMEIKLKKDPGMRGKDHYPDWLLEQLDSDHVSKLKISKYNYGIYNLYTDRCYIAPHWIDDLNMFMAVGPASAPMPPPIAPKKLADTSMTVGTRGNIINVNSTTSKSLHAEGSSVTLLSNHSSENSQNEVNDDANRGAGGKKSPWHMPKWMGAAMAKKTEKKDDGAKGGVPMGATAITIPTNRPLLRKKGVDAKALLANERNYFHWVRMSVFMAVFALGLIHLQGKGVKEKVTLITCSIDVVIIYATIQFHRRARELTRGAVDPAVKIFYSKYGPTALAVGMLMFFTVYMVLLWVLGEEQHAYIDPALNANLALQISNTP